jgi:lysophospholipase L1-like esterase
MTDPPALGGRTTRPGITRFATLGDSVTVGLGDPLPHGGWRGWAALLGESLAPPGYLEMTNLAHCGALARDVAIDQLPRALAQRPALASVLVGVNDTLRGDFDLAAIAAHLEYTIARLGQSGALVVTASLPNPGLMLRIPDLVRRPLARRAQAINAVIDHLSSRYGTIHIDLAGHPALYERPMWGIDRMHPSERGHRLLALLYAAALTEHGVPLWTPPDPEPASPPPTARSQAGWLATKGTGWLFRRSRDLLPRLVQLVMAEWWHQMRDQTAQLDTRLRSELDDLLRRNEAPPAPTVLTR